MILKNLKMHVVICKEYKKENSDKEIGHRIYR